VTAGHAVVTSHLKSPRIGELLSQIVSEDHLYVS